MAQQTLPLPESRTPSPEEIALLTRLQKLWPDVVTNIRNKSAFLGSVLVAGKPSKLYRMTSCPLALPPVMAFTVKCSKSQSIALWLKKN